MPRRLALLWMALLSPFAVASPPAGDVLIDSPPMLLSVPLEAPFMAPLGNSIPGPLRPAPLEPAFTGDGCGSSVLDLCFDLGQRRAVYRHARAYMPAIEGLRAEGISVRRGSVVFKYTFR